LQEASGFSTPDELGFGADLRLLDSRLGFEHIRPRSNASLAATASIDLPGGRSYNSPSIEAEAGFQGETDA
jgi:hypothetical protein